MYPHATAIGIDLGRFVVHTAVVRYDGKILLKDSFPLAARLTRKNIIESLENALHATREKAADKRINPIAVGVSAPGFIDYENGIILGPDHGVKGWKNIRLASLLSDGSGLPVYVDNDANLMTVAEHRFGAAKGFRNAVFVALRTGIGGGIIIDGKLYRGANNTGGEIGMMIIDPWDRNENRRGRGTLEEYASGAALVRRYLKLKNKDHDKESALRAKDIFELGASGDKHAVEALKENAVYVGIGLSNIVSIFAPEIIVVGGGMALAGESYLKEIRRETLANTLPYSSKGLKIEPASLGVDAAVIGPAWYALNRLDGN